jgi:hypothetical protein
LWIAISEFARNQVLLKSAWEAHYQRMGQVFPAAPLNGAIWGLWSLCFAIAIFAIARTGSLVRATALAWFIGFVLMWLVIGNLGVLPFAILPLAIPLSLVEACGAVYIVRRLSV